MPSLRRCPLAGTDQGFGDIGLCPVGCTQPTKKGDDANSYDGAIPQDPRDPHSPSNSSRVKQSSARAPPCWFGGARDTIRQRIAKEPSHYLSIVSLRHDRPTHADLSGARQWNGTPGAILATLYQGYPRFFASGIGRKRTASRTAAG